MTTHHVPARRRPVALLLPGQGAQHLGMAVELYGHDRGFTARMDAFFDLLGPEHGPPMRADWLAGADRPAELLDGPWRAQPLLFAVACALARGLGERGVRPDVLLGHSVGELAAAALSGVFDLGAAARLMTARSDALAQLPPGGMLSVAAPPAELAGYLGPADRADSVVIGAVNAPRQTVLAGPEPELQRVADRLTAAGTLFHRVRAPLPFHSPAAAEAGEHLTRALAGMTLHPPRIPIQSTRTGRRVTESEALDPGFWARQLAQPVLFWPALDALLAEGGHTLVEAGPGRSLSVLARRHPAVRGGRSDVLALLPSGAEGTRDAWRQAPARLAAAGFEPLSAGA
ncbi:acyltransferase domain-containing protein [Streptomyces boncukensis]|uniref:Acyltransferase domain-containing protein n=1 Tax=Streptomyces boncukensis TaxID=2711219 RepID=A0A6G4WYB6_9ACTN|nr:acyltransferase domain-containing protein [Streptomyces boncukensis]NGO70289.1 acyltransferase domain-containing protein [Streptomyces boncukensis]